MFITHEMLQVFRSRKHNYLNYMSFIHRQVPNSQDTIILSSGIDSLLIIWLKKATVHRLAFSCSWRNRKLEAKDKICAASEYFSEHYHTFHTKSNKDIWTLIKHLRVHFLFILNATVQLKWIFLKCLCGQRALQNKVYIFWPGHRN